MIKNEKQYKIAKSWLAKFLSGTNSFSQSPRADEKNNGESIENRRISSQLVSTHSSASASTYIPILQIRRFTECWPRRHR